MLIEIKSSCDTQMKTRKRELCALYEMFYINAQSAV
ncbi:MAG: hypothetical protein ACI9KF_000842, partial [Arenicella sp.]|jgi:hypothetical protein